MKKHSIIALTTTLLALALPLSASALSIENARTIVAPFYAFLSNPLSETHMENAKHNFHPD